jgi:hypothetical protein
MGRVQVKLSDEDIAELTADPRSVYLPMPSLAELDYAITLIHKEHPVDAWYLRRRLKWLVKVMNKEYKLGWTTPWDK